MGFFTKRSEYGGTEPRFERVFLTAIGVFILLILFFGSFSIVRAGHVGVVTRFGAVQRVVSPGVVLKIPLVEGVKSMETRTQKEEVDATSASKDLQDVNAKVAINFHLDGLRAVDVYQNIGVDYKERVVAPAIQESFKAATAKYTASDLIVKREEVKRAAYTDLRNRLMRYHIVIDDINIVNFDFSSEFNKAIESKVQAQQTLEQTRIEAETARTQAQGQADAQAILQESGSLSPAYLEFLAIQKWDGKLPLATQGNPFLQIPGR